MTSFFRVVQTRAVSVLRLLPFIAGCACVAWPASASAAASRIGVLLKDNYSMFWIKVGEGAQRAGKDAGAEIFIKGSPNPSSVGKQKQFLNTLLGEGIDALVIAPLIGENIVADVAALKGSGIKIVTLDTPLSPGIADAHVEIDQEEMSESATRMFIALFNENDEIAILRNNRLDQVTMNREKHIFMAVKARYPHIVIHANIYSGNDPASDEKFARQLLETHPRIKAVLTSSTATSIAMLKAREAAGVTNKIRQVGFGTYLPQKAADALRKGELDGWIAQEPQDLGYKAVEAALKLLRNEPAGKKINARFEAVTKARLDEQAVKDLLIP